LKFLNWVSSKLSMKKAWKLICKRFTLGLHAQCESSSVANQTDGHGWLKLHHQQQPCSPKKPRPPTDPSLLPAIDNNDDATRRRPCTSGRQQCQSSQLPIASFFSPVLSNVRRHHSLSQMGDSKYHPAKHNDIYFTRVRTLGILNAYV
jgi:hypothetical protein